MLFLIVLPEISKISCIFAPEIIKERYDTKICHYYRTCSS